MKFLVHDAARGLFSWKGHLAGLLENHQSSDPSFNSCNWLLENVIIVIMIRLSCVLRQKRPEPSCLFEQRKKEKKVYF